MRFPRLGAATGWGFEELERKAGDYAVVAVAAAVTVRDGVIESARIGLAGAADRPVRATAAEAALQGQPATAEPVAAAAAAISAQVTADAVRDASFASHVAGVLGAARPHQRPRAGGEQHMTRARSRSRSTAASARARPSRASCCPTSSARTSG